jgi:hypothetical protein
MPARIYDNLSVRIASVSNSHSAALIGSSILGWGSSAKNKLDFPKGEYQSVACGFSHSAAVDTSGRIVTIGNALGGKLNSGTLNSRGQFKTVRCSRNYTAATLDCSDGKYRIAVFGDQRQYSVLPSTVYSKTSKDEGVFTFDSAIGDFDISDDGTIVIDMGNGSVTVVGASMYTVNGLTAQAVKVRCGDTMNTTTVAIIHTTDQKAFVLTRNHHGMKVMTEIAGDVTDVFCGNKYYGYVVACREINLVGDHFGNIRIPDGWRIEGVDGGNNGYAIRVIDNDSDKHLVLVGDNTKNKELVINGYDHRECPRKDGMIYEIREAKVAKAKPTVTAAVSTIAEDGGEDSDYECEPCKFRFAASSPVCPLCKNEVTANV